MPLAHHDPATTGSLHKNWLASTVLAAGPAKSALAAAPPSDGPYPPSPSTHTTDLIAAQLFNIQRHLIEAQARLHSERDRLFGPQPKAAASPHPEARHAALPDLLALAEMVTAQAATLDEDTRFLMEI